MCFISVKSFSNHRLLLKIWCRRLSHLSEKGLDKNTVIIYASDQDFYLGENGWFDKRWMYDVSMHMPFIIQWPGMIQAGSRSDVMIQNIDFAPTLLDIAGLPIPSSMQGMSIKSLLLSQAKKLPREYLYYHYQEYPEPYHNVLPHAGIRGERYKLIWFYTTGEWELYDLKSDPDEQLNLANRKKYRKLFSDMKKKFVEVTTHYEDPVVNRMF